MEFKNRLVELRTHTKNSQQKIANSLGIAQSTYNNYEQGNSEPNIERLKNLADFYNISLDYLVGRDFQNELGFVTDKEKEVLKYFRAMSEENQKIILGECKGVLLAQL